MQIFSSSQRKPFHPIVAMGSWLLLLVVPLAAQNPPFDIYPEAQPPYYRVRYLAGTESGQLIFPVNYTIWIPPDVQRIRGIVVHQHGCGEGSCKSGLTGAYDLHWQALARKHDCALLAPAYEQPQAADCQMWCDPRNGSANTFLRSLDDFSNQSGHAELAEVPWALWGHSGGGHWVGGMVMLFPQRVIAAWMRSGVPLIEADANQPHIQPHAVPELAKAVPMMCNLGTTEGYSVKNADFAHLWALKKQFFEAIRLPTGLIGIAIDPRSGHECGNQRYLAIRWLDACMAERLTSSGGAALKPLDESSGWFGNHETKEIFSAQQVAGDRTQLSWLPDQATAHAWQEYATDTEVVDSSPPPAPFDLQVKGDRIAWQAQGDLESGIAKFLIFRDDQWIATVPENGQNKHGRSVFQGLSYSDTPFQPLATMSYIDQSVTSPEQHTYRVVSVNTFGLRSDQ